MTRSASALLLGLLLQGCASTIHSHQVQPDLVAGQPVDGVPFRIRDRFTMELYRKTDKGYVLVNTQLATLADPTRLYVLNFTGQVLADSSVKFEQLPDGSLSTVKLGSTSHAAEAVTAASSGVDAFVATDKAIKAARKADAADAKAAAAAVIADADAASGQSQSAVALTYAARVLEQQLAELPSDAKPSERLALQGQVDVAKMKAVAAAAKAGLDNPFP